MLRLEPKEGVRRQHVGVVDETTFLTHSDPEFSLIRFAATHAALVFGVRG